jgi:hypothetical protein
MENAMEVLQIYLDGLALEGKVGTAAVLILNSRHIQTLHYHLGPDMEYMVHKAKLVGLLLSLQC